MFYVCEMLNDEGDVNVCGTHASLEEARQAAEYLHVKEAMNVEIVSSLGDEGEETVATYIH